jgi:hypothetical protein
MAGWSRPSSHITVLLDGRTDIAPWVSKTRVDRDGVLWIGVRGEAPPQGCRRKRCHTAVW